MSPVYIALLFLVAALGTISGAWFGDWLIQKYPRRTPPAACWKLNASPGVEYAVRGPEFEAGEKVTIKSSTKSVTEPHVITKVRFCRCTQGGQDVGYQYAYQVDGMQSWWSSSSLARIDHSPADTSYPALIKNLKEASHVQGA